MSKEEESQEDMVTRNLSIWPRLWQKKKKKNNSKGEFRAVTHLWWVFAIVHINAIVIVIVHVYVKVIIIVMVIIINFKGSQVVLSVKTHVWATQSLLLPANTFQSKNCNCVTHSSLADFPDAVLVDFVSTICFIQHPRRFIQGTTTA